MQEISSAGLSASLTNLAIPDPEQCLIQQVLVHAYLYVYVYVYVTSKHCERAHLVVQLARFFSIIYVSNNAFGPETACALRTNVNGLASSTRHQCIAFNKYVYVYVTSNIFSSAIICISYNTASSDMARIYMYTRRTWAHSA